MSARGFAESSTATRNGSELNANINGGGVVLFSAPSALLQLSVEEKAVRLHDESASLFDVNLLDVELSTNENIRMCFVIRRAVMCTFL